MKSSCYVHCADVLLYFEWDPEMKLLYVGNVYIKLN